MKQLNQLDNDMRQYIDNKLLALQASINTSITAQFKAYKAKHENNNI